MKIFKITLESIQDVTTVTTELVKLYSKRIKYFKITPKRSFDNVEFDLEFQTAVAKDLIKQTLIDECGVGFVEDYLNITKVE